MLVSLHEHFPVRVTDWLLSAILLSWGVNVLFLEPAIWSLPIYSGLAAIADQTTWAIFAIGLGLARIAALFVNGAIRRSPHLRALGAFLAIFVWVQISLGLMWSDSSGGGAAIFPWLALADIFNVYRAANDARIADHNAMSWRRAVVARHVSERT